MDDEKKYLDYEGVRYLWSKISMEDYPNNELLMAVIDAIDETKANKEYVDDLFSQKIQEQADWNETNNLELSYIKNKPFGYKDDLYTNPELSFSLLRDSIYVGKIPQELTNLFTTGDKITVIWDQEEYDLTAKIVNVKLEHADIDFLNALGNGEILAKALESLTDSENSGEPFAICPGFGEIYTRSTSPIHSVIIRDKTNVNKLDLKFLPDEVIALQSDWNESDENSKAFIKNKPIIPNFEEYSTKDYVDNAVAQKTQVQIITWEADD